MIILDPVPVTDAVLVSTNVPAENQQYSPTGVYGPGELVNYDAPNSHGVYQQLQGATHEVTLTIASPGVVNWTAHGLPNGKPVKLTTTGVLPAGVTAGTTYYVVSAGTNSFQLAATVGGAALDFTSGQSGTHTLTANDIGKPVSDEDYWVFKSITNARAMFDSSNSTQTQNPDVITVVLQPNAITRGVYMAVEGASVDITATDPVDGTVYPTKSQSLLISNSGSSFYKWMFNRILRRKAILALDLPPYRSMQITINVRNPGGVAKCGMCCVGPLLDIGLSQYGISREIKDYSTTTFDVDGTDNTVVRGYRKIMGLDVLVRNEFIDSVIDTLEQYRQRAVVWIGTTRFKHTAIFGTYSSFKNVIPDNVFSRCTVNIDGKV